MVKLSALLALCALATVTEAALKSCTGKKTNQFKWTLEKEYILNGFDVEAPRALPPYKAVYGSPQTTCRVVNNGAPKAFRCDVGNKEARSDYMEIVSLGGEEFEICNLFLHNREECPGEQKWSVQNQGCYTPAPTCASNQKVVYGQCQCRFGLDLQGNCLNSSNCPANSVLRRGRCTCNSGYKVSGNSCIMSNTCGPRYKPAGDKCGCKFGLNVDGRTCLTGTAPGSCPPNSKWQSPQCRCNDRHVVQPGNKCDCAPNMFHKDGKCYCNAGFDFVGGRCAARRCPHGRQFMGWLANVGGKNDGCMCEEAENFNGMCCFKFGAGNVAAGRGFCCGGHARIVNRKCECLPSAQRVMGGGRVLSCIGGGRKMLGGLFGNGSNGGNGRNKFGGLFGKK